MLLPFGLEGFFFLDVLVDFPSLVSECPCLKSLLDPPADCVPLEVRLHEEGMGPNLFCDAVPPLAT